MVMYITYKKIVSLLKYFIVYTEHVITNHKKDTININNLNKWLFSYINRQYISYKTL